MELTKEQQAVIAKVTEMLYQHFDSLSESDQEAFMSEAGVTHGELNFAHRFLVGE